MLNTLLLQLQKEIDEGWEACKIKILEEFPETINALTMFEDMLKQVYSLGYIDGKWSNKDESKRS